MVSVLAHLSQILRSFFVSPRELFSFVQATSVRIAVVSILLSLQPFWVTTDFKIRFKIEREILVSIAVN